MSDIGRLKAEVARLTADRDNAAKEAVAAWMIAHSFATGHGDTLDGLLYELVGHAADNAAKEMQERCAKVAEAEAAGCCNTDEQYAQRGCCVLNVINGIRALTKDGAT